ncbi:cell division protein FtsA [Fructilactobacillus frigidiflavus]|uniref:cell division protein FtsA n=1 Tax=Fructilactobacillus frigidiflavus TaxID=3242688 RepID=UPI0037572545
MNESDIYIGLDIGTTSIKSIVAQRVDGRVSVIGFGNEVSAGVSRGIIVDIDKAAQAIKKSISQAETKSGVQISSVVVGLPADKISINHCSGMINLPDSSKEIDNQDIANVAQAAIANSIPQERELIDLISEEFKIDGFDQIPDPRGMVGSHLELDGRIITGPKTIIHNVRKAVEKAGLRIDMMVVSAEAEGRTILSESEQNFGTILIDLGGGQSTAAVIHDHELKYVDVDHEGGQFITRDISSVLGTSLKEAENIKQEYGFADVDQASSENTFSVDVVGRSQPENVSEKLLAQIIEARLEQIFGRLRDKLADVNALEMPGGIVMTGGVSALPGIAELAANTFGVNVRIYAPNQMGIRHASFANGLSLVEYASGMAEIAKVIRSAFDDNFYFEEPEAEESDFVEETRTARRETQQPQSTTEESHEGIFSSLKKLKKDDKKTKKAKTGFAFKNFFE